MKLSVEVYNERLGQMINQAMQRYPAKNESPPHVVRGHRIRNDLCQHQDSTSMMIRIAKYLVRETPFSRLILAVLGQFMACAEIRRP